MDRCRLIGSNNGSFSALANVCSLEYPSHGGNYWKRLIVTVAGGKRTLELSSGGSDDVRVSGEWKKRRVLI